MATAAAIPRPRSFAMVSSDKAPRAPPRGRAPGLALGWPPDFRARRLVIQSFRWPPTSVVGVVEEGQAEEQGIAIQNEHGAYGRQEQAEEKGGPGARKDGHRGHDDGDLQEDLGEVEIRVLGLETVACRLEALGRLLDLLLLGVVALLFLLVLLEQRLELLAPLGPERRAALDQVGLQPQLLAPVLVLADDLGLIEGPLVGRLLLGEQHLLGGVAAPEPRDGEEDGVDGSAEGHAPPEAALGLLAYLLRIRHLYFRHRATGSPVATGGSERVQMRGGARRSHARRTLCTLSVRPRAPSSGCPNVEDAAWARGSLRASAHRRRWALSGPPASGRCAACPSLPSSPSDPPRRPRGAGSAAPRRTRGPCRRDRPRDPAPPPPPPAPS